MSAFNVITASAGSGKTYTLCTHYIRLAIQDPNRLKHGFKTILAVTFTNKAASELKFRILKSLEQIYLNHPDAKAISNNLIDELKLSPDELRDRCKRLHGFILHQYSQFSISTLDSFTHKLVRSFHQELDLPGPFKIELDVKGFYHSVIGELMDLFGSNKPITKVITDYAKSQIHDASHWDPQQLLWSFTDVLEQENARPYIEKIRSISDSTLEEHHRNIITTIKTYQTEVLDLNERCLQTLHTFGLQAEDLSGKSKGVWLVLDKIKKKKTCKPEYFENVQFKKSLDSELWVSNLKKNSAANSQLNSQINALIGYVSLHFESYDLCYKMRGQIYFLRLLKEIETLCLNRKEQEQSVFIGELNAKIQKITQEESAHFIFERMGNRYSHFLIDEFQDTSRIQWLNFIPLIENAIAQGKNSYVVGDGKQSIYRWRNADVQQFINLPTLGSESYTPAADTQQLFKSQFKPNVLNVNWRSSPEIVNFNSGFFKFICESQIPDKLKAIYKTCHQTTPNNISQKYQGYVQIHCEEIESERVNEVQLQTLFSNIQECVSHGYNYGSQVVLCRSNRVASALAVFLIEQEIPVISSESLLLSEHPHVTTLVSGLNYIKDQNLHIEGMVLVHRAFQILGLDAQQAQQLECSYHQLKLPPEKILQNLGFEFYPETLESQNPFDICLNLIRIFKLGEAGTVYMRFFLDVIQHAYSEYGHNLIDVLNYWNSVKHSASLKTPEQLNAVKIMTIHKSKGLEFPVVHVPYCNWKLVQTENIWVSFSNRNNIPPVAYVSVQSNSLVNEIDTASRNASEMQLLDQANVLYVALTRAKHRLYVQAQYPKKPDGKTTERTDLISNWLLQYLKLLQPSQSSVFTLGLAEHYTNTATPVSDKLLERDIFNVTEPVLEIASTRYNSNFQAAEYGNYFHSALKSVISIHDLPKLYEKLNFGAWSKSPFASKALKEIQALFKNPNFSEYFSESFKVLNERDFTGIDGSLRRPDRMMIHQNSLIVMDYKTGSERYEHHRQQLLDYINEMKAFGFNTVKGVLVYSESGELIYI